MSTNAPAVQEQDPPDEWVSDSAVVDQKAPKAEPEEDFDILDSGAEATTLQDYQGASIISIIGATELDSQESTGESQWTPRETREVVTELEQAPQKPKIGNEFEEPVDLCEDSFPPPPPPPLLSPVSLHKFGETEAFSSLEGEVAEGISDVEAIPDPIEDLTFLDGQSGQEETVTTQLSEPDIQEVPTLSQDIKGEEMTVEEYVAQLKFHPEGISSTQTENNKSKPCHDSHNDNQDDVNTLSSPPFADESEEEVEKEEELTGDYIPPLEKLNIIDICNEAVQHSTSAAFSAPTIQESRAILCATSSAQQQEELLPQSCYVLAPRGEKQEAAQQVLGPGSPPLSAVAIEPSNPGGAASHGLGCVVAVRERHGRAGEKTEEENEQTGGEEGQKDCKVGGKEPAGQQATERLLGHSETVQTEEEKVDNIRCGVSLEQSRHTRMESDSYDENQSDSGVSVDFLPHSTMEGTSISKDTPADFLKETPIEREIRRSVEREHSLRRSRGLPDPTTTQQFVEIPLRKAVLSQSVTGKPERHQDKDRELAGKVMQQEIYEETQREQDLVKLGKIPGVYDKGTVREMKERKLIFEAFQAPSEPTFTIPSRSKAPSWSSASEVSNLESQEDLASQSSTMGGSYAESKRSLDFRGPTPYSNSAKGRGSTNSTRRGPGFPEGTGLQVIILENDISVLAEKCHVKTEMKDLTVVDSGKPHIPSSSLKDEEEEEEEEEGEATPKENPFFKLRSPTNVVKVRQDIQETHEREKELRKQRKSLHRSGANNRGGRGGGGRPNSMLSSPVNGLTVSDIHGSSSKGGTGPSAAQQSVNKSSAWPSAPAEEEKINQPEVPQPPWSPRQKSPLVQRWESALLNGHNKDDD